MTVRAQPPGDDEFELTLLGPGYGESVILHIGAGVWIVVDSCGRADAPAALDYLRGIKFRRAPTPDAIRLRRRIASGARWEVELLGSACHLSDFDTR